MAYESFWRLVDKSGDCWQTECLNGHPFDDANTYQRERNGSMRRECITCRREAVSRCYKRSRERAVQ